MTARRLYFMALGSVRGIASGIAKAFGSDERKPEKKSIKDLRGMM